MNTINEEIYSLGLKIGLNKKDVDSVLTNTSPINELPSNMFGPKPPDYLAALGTISIKIF